MPCHHRGPENKFTPDYGKDRLAYRSPGGFGIRLDGGMGYSGAVITPFYDSMLVKVIASGQTYPIAMDRMDVRSRNSASAG